MTLLYDSGPAFSRVTPPFARLPPELQLGIFTLCLHQEEYPLLRKGTFPWVFLSVCRRWRELCISAPHLWSRFEVDINRCCTAASVNGDAPLVNVIKRCIRLSNEYPLSIRLIYHSQAVRGRTLELDPTCTRIISLLLPHVERWRRMAFSLPSACISPLFQSAVPHRLTSLKALALDIEGVNGWSSGEQCLNVMCLGIEWTQITALHLNLEDKQSLSLDSCLTILSQTRKLITCTLNCHCDLTDSMKPVDDSDWNMIHAELPELRELHLVVQGKRHVSSERNFMSFLDRLHSLTALKSLQLEWLLPGPRPVDLPTGGPATVSAPHHAMLVSFLDRLGTGLETFRLSYLPLTPVQLVDCLVVLPSIVNLELRFSLSTCGPITDVFFQGLILGVTRNVGSERRMVLPFLESLKLECCGSSHESFPYVINTFLKHRKRVKVFSLFTRTRLDELEDEAVVARWKKRGIQVSFRSLLLT
ncbi:hypothetical protein L218DRAFT_984435 [Marasmius fiardii PR-910]|nr:hypothetical protein L218DRAFT_984435 [Marasmius fiardii PR-910]